MRQDIDRITLLNISISIHAPTWGATAAAGFDSPPGSISIHAPTWGATLAAHRVGVEPRISIHAPTWGATPRHAPRDGSPLFQSTHPRGVRLSTAFLPVESWVFQSTHPRGVRHPVCPRSAPCRTFQSTHPRGVRHQACRRKNDGDLISIHAPTWGATPLREHHPHEIDISIHAPTWGATYC